MIFQTFLAKTKHVFKIFEEIGEPKPESAKIRFLLDAVRSTELQPSVQAIRAGMTLDPNVNTFTTAANMIASQGCSRLNMQMDIRQRCRPTRSVNACSNKLIEKAIGCCYLRESSIIDRPRMLSCKGMHL
jgi:hypothetical protein